MTIPVTIDRPAHIEKVGLEDGQEIILKCSNCLKNCCSIKVTRPDAKDKDGNELNRRVRASCAYGCKKRDNSPDMSFSVNVKGSFHFAGCFKSDGDDIKLVTSIIDIRQEKDSDGEVTTYYTKQINKG